MFKELDNSIYFVYFCLTKARFPMEMLSLFVIFLCQRSFYHQCRSNWCDHSEVILRVEKVLSDISERMKNFEFVQFVIHVTDSQ